mgnify:CR=1 FL=1
MGCGLSKNSVVPMKWKHFIPPLETKQKLINNKLISIDCCPDEVELCILLDDLIIYPYLKTYINSNSNNNNTYKLTNKSELNKLLQLYCELYQFKSIVNFHTKKFQELIRNYSNCIKCFDIHESILINEIISNSNDNGNKNKNQNFMMNDDINNNTNNKNTDTNTDTNATMELSLYQRMVRNAGHYIYIHIYTSFIDTNEYIKMCDGLKYTYNTVTTDDFEYISKIAEGGFGLVLQCRRKTTGEVYAMKVQLKAAQLKNVKREYSKLMFEHQAYCSTNHPYVASLAYSFQSDIFTFLVLPMYKGGDLLKAAGVYNGNRLGIDRVQFYAAEVASALMYLHCRGILYRDLKPANVLLNADGHIALADFGSIADIEGQLKNTIIQEDENENANGNSTTTTANCPTTIHKKYNNNNTNTNGNANNNGNSTSANTNTNTEDVSVDCQPQHISVAGTRENSGSGNSIGNSISNRSNSNGTARGKAGSVIYSNRALDNTNTNCNMNNSNINIDPSSVRSVQSNQSGQSGRTSDREISTERSISLISNGVGCTPKRTRSVVNKAKSLVGKCIYIWL